VLDRVKVEMVRSVNARFGADSCMPLENLEALVDAMRELKDDSSWLELLGQKRR
jgi:hypothetical protein